MSQVLSVPPQLEFSGQEQCDANLMMSSQKVLNVSMDLFFLIPTHVGTWLYVWYRPESHPIIRSVLCTDLGNKYTLLGARSSGDQRPVYEHLNTT